MKARLVSLTLCAGLSAGMGLVASPAVASGWDWAQLADSSAAHPEALTGVAMAAEPNGRVLAFGGDNGNTPYSSTWEWDGSAWSQLAPTTSPPARGGAAMAADGLGGLILYGGYSDNSGPTPLYDTWRWNGSNWAHLTPVHVPDVQDESAFHLASDTWTWDGQTWNQETTSSQPEARSGPSSATAAGGVLLYGGNSASALHDTWSWAYIDTTPPTVTLTAPASAFTLGTTVRVSYTGHDDVAVTGYDVRWRRAPYDGGFGSWHYPSSWQNTTSTSRTLSGLAPGYEYCFSARSRDAADNVSPWPAAARCVARPLDDVKLARTTTWTRHQDIRFYLSTYTSTTVKGATLSRTGA
ncbi:MAG: large repetitive protein [Actinomycetota bacterium]|nr:large repetitive protein [Actinomycetota bacterium]